MKDEHGAQKACEDKKPLIDGRRANVQLAYLGAKKKTKDGKRDELLFYLSSFIQQCF